jgi:hypothetical protein
VKVAPGDHGSVVVMTPSAECASLFYADLYVCRPDGWGATSVASVSSWLAWSMAVVPTGAVGAARQENTLATVPC